MKFTEPRPFADPERKLVELANAFEPIQDGRIYIEKINGPFLFELKGTPAEYKAGLDCAIENGWLASLEQQIFRRAGKSHSIWSAELPRSMATEDQADWAALSRRQAQWRWPS
jgi:hypothetical protein